MRHRPIPAVLPTAYVVLRILILLNWLMGAAIIALLLVMPHEEWIMKAFELEPGPDAQKILWGLRWIALIGLVSVPLHHAILKRLSDMVETVGAGDPFVALNARRLRAIGVVLVVLQGLALAVGAISASITTPDHPVEMGGLSPSGILAVVMTFVLARVFAAGTEMRDELDGTV